MPDVVKPSGSIEELDQFILREAKTNSGLVPFALINSFIHGFNWGSFVVDHDPYHEEPHPVDEHLLSLEERGGIAVDMTREQIIVLDNSMFTSPASANINPTH